MASFSFILYFTFLSLLLVFVHSDSEILSLSSDEQESAYKVLESVDSFTDWRNLFPDDLCYSGPHGLVCDYFVDENGNGSFHITELSFGYVSDYSSNPLCSVNATFSFSLTTFSHLKKLFFYKCFTQTDVSIPGYFSNLSSTLEELVFIENPSLFGTLNGKMISNLKNLKKIVLTGTNVSGEIPDEIGDLVHLEQITLSRNRLNGEVPLKIGGLRNLKVLDLSFNGFQGFLPASIGNLTELLKLDLGSNSFNGKIPESIVGLQRLEFLDLSWNQFGNYGVPLFVGEMKNLKEIYLSGNQLGGHIPEIWENLGGILGLGLSGLGLVGKIPISMGVKLKNICYLGLDNNTLEGPIPEEFSLMDSIHELNLENNRLSGRIKLHVGAKIGGKMKLGGNHGLCVDKEELGGNRNYLKGLKICKKQASISNDVIFSGCSSILPSFDSFMFLKLLLACIFLLFL